METINKEQKTFLEYLLNNKFVDNYHKTLLKGIKGDNFKNISIADKEVLIDLFRRYKHLK